MRELNFELDKRFIRPVVNIRDTLTSKVYTCMYDTGAIISVWCSSEEMFFRTFSYRDSGLIRTIRGIGDAGRICKVWLIDIKISGILFCNVPIVLYDGATAECDFILSHTLFRDYDVLFKRGSLCISGINNHVIVYSIKSINNIYHDVLLQQENLSKCPLCGNELLSTGICLNILCAYNDLFFT